jgi:hypothetical protein
MKINQLKINQALPLMKLEQLDTNEPFITQNGTMDSTEPVTGGNLSQFKGGGSTKNTLKQPTIGNYGWKFEGMLKFRVEDDNASLSVDKFLAFYSWFVYEP